MNKLHIYGMFHSNLSALCKKSSKLAVVGSQRKIPEDTRVVVALVNAMLFTQYVNTMMLIYNTLIDVQTTQT